CRGRYQQLYQVPNRLPTGRWLDEHRWDPRRRRGPDERTDLGGREGRGRGRLPPFEGLAGEGAPGPLPPPPDAIRRLPDDRPRWSGAPPDRGAGLRGNRRLESVYEKPGWRSRRVLSEHRPARPGRLGTAPRRRGSEFGRARPPDEPLPRRRLAGRLA